ncbi:phospho-sugar mutase [Lacisediminihabitans changchengi]|uniref:Phospho-sugar mutase n=1 Tax=Lacisediminihabitans changchengi TaxID=2787634 RepID=A0A934W3E1_9MICO|nr:phospho-sugar mutase [Lacisediminihabitans changchengi]MBK4348873.1 phospho-sugar mutase [Lacisediminihabitans changchengi]
MTLLDVAKAWRDQDPDLETREELDGLIADVEAGDDDAVAQLHDRFDTRLEFGTAGLRGRIEAGSNRMNRVLVAQAAAGLAAFLLAREEHPSIVIGYDGRKNSRVFATDTAELMAGVGVRAIILPRELPTPVLAFAVRQLGVSAGVMVTASHNPPQDNGYKVYLGGADHGSQIVPPADGEIAAEILRVAATANVLELPRSPKFETAGEEILDEYVRRTAALASGSPTLRYVYTALHGVGWETAHRVFREAGFAEPIAVRQQIEPDAGFPTVSFPNPEEPGAMDLAFALATAENADLVIANDPDADRLAIGVPTTEGWERLSGNEVGALLGWRAAERLNGSGTLAASIVSSPALAAVAHHYGLTYTDTLTGFKWVSRVPGLSFGYEEALGYLVDPDKIRDKDGISAAVDFLALATELRAAGSSLREHRLAFADTFGGFASGQVSIRVSDLGQIRQIMQRLRTNLPEAIGETAVDRVDDFADGFEQFPAGDILRFWLADGSRVIVRPSGTEPKVKVYLDASSTDGTADARLASARSKVAALETAMRALLA